MSISRKRLLCLLLFAVAAGIWALIIIAIVNPRFYRIRKPGDYRIETRPAPEITLSLPQKRLVAGFRYKFRVTIKNPGTERIAIFRRNVDRFGSWETVWLPGDPDPDDDSHCLRGGPVGAGIHVSDFQSLFPGQETCRELNIYTPYTPGIHKLKYQYFARRMADTNPSVGKLNDLLWKGTTESEIEVEIVTLSDASCALPEWTPSREAYFDFEAFRGLSESRRRSVIWYLDRLKMFGQPAPRGVIDGLLSIPAESDDMLDERLALIRSPGLLRIPEVARACRAFINVYGEHFRSWSPGYSLMCYGGEVGREYIVENLNSDDEEKRRGAFHAIRTYEKIPDRAGVFVGLITGEIRTDERERAVSILRNLVYSGKIPPDEVPVEKLVPLAEGDDPYARLISSLLISIDWMKQPKQDSERGPDETTNESK